MILFAASADIRFGHQKKAPRNTSSAFAPLGRGWHAVLTDSQDAVRIIPVVHRPQSRPDGAALRKANLVRPGLKQRFFSPDLPAQNLAHDRGDVVAVEVPVGAQLERAL
jgi:hypothetical protein